MFLDREDVRRAFAEKEFFPLFQPQVELSTGQLAGFEVLARWNHSRLGAIPPDAFIPVLQKHGFMNTLTKSLLGKVFATVPLLPDSLRLAINVSPLQLLDVTIPGRIADAAALSGFPLERLTIEITEIALFEDLSLAQSVAGELKLLHCRLSLDDFGKGYSSLFHLQDLPFDELKVDQSFIHAMTQGTPCHKILAAVIGLGRSLGLRTVAEGVETDAETGMLNEMGCDLAQGWRFGRPAPADDIPQMVSATFAVCAPR
jgi:EAL domain-containing protein (putative c-di-GMP-specific phosphodiesterase class I)